MIAICTECKRHVSKVGPLWKGGFVSKFDRQRRAPIRTAIWLCKFCRKKSGRVYR